MVYTVAYGAIPSPRLPLITPVYGYTDVLLPSRFTLGSMPPVLDQGTNPWCVVGAAAGIITRDEIIEAGVSPVIDMAELYAYCKTLDGIPNVPGTYPVTVLDVLQKRGAYTINGAGPSHFKISGYRRVNPYRADLKNAVFSGKAVFLTMNWNASWDSTLSNGQLPRIELYGGKELWNAYHQAIVWGWDDRIALGLLCRNDWTRLWGMNGNFYIPWDYVDRQDIIVEAWVMDSVKIS